MTRRFNRKSVRFPGYDYTQPGYYFVTIGVKNMKCIFGHIADVTMYLNDAGKIAEKCWKEIPEHFPHAQIDEYIVMPDHIHGIIVIESPYIGARHAVPLYMEYSENFGKPVSGSIPTIVRSYKSVVTKLVRGKIWQRNYYLVIINNQRSLNRIRQYIKNNPAQWEEKHAA